MEQRIEEFTQKGKDFAYYDLSDFKTNDEFKEFVEAAKERIAKYAEHSLLTITNIRDVKFDSETKSIVAEWMKYNKPYVKFGTVIGFDGIKKIMVNAIFKLCGRKNMIFVSSKEQAIEWLLKQE
jgi:predicted PolB exonuclease-like 3'-5' exonuclease